MEMPTSSLSASERYKLLVGLVFPRPIALVSTRSENGVANCAPYSFFNAICEDPMLVIVSFSRRSDGKMKHSLANLLRTGGFVVNLVDEGIANGMHISSKEVDEDVSEFSGRIHRGVMPRYRSSTHRRGASQFRVQAVQAG